MLGQDVYVIDAVAHAYNLDPCNYYNREHAEAITEMVYGVVAGAPEGYGVPRGVRSRLVDRGHRADAVRRERQRHRGLPPRSDHGLPRRTRRGREGG